MIAIGSDHGGYALKQAVMKHLESRGEQYHDFGTYSEASCDYPDYGRAVAEAVASGEYQYGIIICGTGIGISITANKVHGIRAALCGDCFSAEATRLHNDANIIAFGARVVGRDLAKMILDQFFGTEFEGGRHQRRVDQMKAVEAFYSKTPEEK